MYEIVKVHNLLAYKAILLYQTGELLHTHCTQGMSDSNISDHDSCPSLHELVDLVRTQEGAITKLLSENKTSKKNWLAHHPIIKNWPKILI